MESHLGCVSGSSTAVRPPVTEAGIRLKFTPVWETQLPTRSSGRRAGNSGDLRLLIIDFYSLSVMFFYFFHPVNCPGKLGGLDLLLLRGGKAAQLNRALESYDINIGIVVLSVIPQCFFDRRG